MILWCGCGALNPKNYSWYLKVRVHLLVRVILSNVRWTFVAPVLCVVVVILYILLIVVFFFSLSLLFFIFVGHNDYVGAVAAWKGTQPIVVSGSSDGTIKAWNTQTGALVATGEGHTRDAWALGVTSEPSAMIVSGSFDRTVRAWDLNPVLLDLNWARRKFFCMFLSMRSLESAVFYK